MGSTLLVLPSVTMRRSPDGRVILTRKFLDGICEYARLWPGRVLLAIETSGAADSNIDHIAVNPGDLPFEIREQLASDAALRDLARTAKLVFAALVPRHVQIANLCASENVPLVYDADMPLSVREGIVRAETPNPVRRWRRLRWTRRMEARYCAAISQANGIQCNGTPAFEAYGGLARPLLYLNTRVRREMLAAPEEREARRTRLLSGQPLRLVYSGRLVAMKGVLDLALVAAVLKQRRVSFTLDIFGSGELQAALEQKTRTLYLTDRVRFHGTLPFPDLVRRVARENDLFVCCHPQGDPATTFLETMSCGLPLVGYDTEGLHGIVSLAGAGWLTPAGRPEELAACIAEVDQNRPALVEAAERAFEFARERTFEQTMRMRVEHLQDCSVRISRGD